MNEARSAALPNPADSTVQEAPASCAISRYKEGRHWAIHAPDGALVCVAVYKKGAAEVARRLHEKETPLADN